MALSKVIDADGHIIERADELRRYLKSPFDKRAAAGGNYHIDGSRGVGIGRF
jgi:hypothetical protein